MTHGDRGTLAEEGRTPCCLNCGGPLAGASDTCSFCESPLVVIDMPRLMAALLMRHAEPLPAEAGQQAAWPCRGCGAPLSPTQTARCDRCRHLVVVPSVLDLRPLLNVVEPLLRAALPRQARPHGEKLKAMRGDASATAFHRYLRHAKDILTGGADAGAAPWIGWGVVAAALWYFWFF